MLWNDLDGEKFVKDKTCGNFNPQEPELLASPFKTTTTWPYVSEVSTIKAKPPLLAWSKALSIFFCLVTLPNLFHFDDLETIDWILS